jgi:hypothetical protein
MQEVRVDDAGRGRGAFLEVRGPSGVDLDGGQWAPEFL